MSEYCFDARFLFKRRLSRVQDRATNASRVDEPMDAFDDGRVIFSRECSPSEELPPEP